MRLKFVCLIGFLLLLPMPSYSTISYHFDFTNLTSSSGGIIADFGLTLSFPDYVTTTGMAPLSGPPLPTTLGYNVAFSGTNNSGWWGFDDDGTAELVDGSFTPYGDAFWFYPIPNLGGYITSPGIFSGFVAGNASGSFGGEVILTVSDTSAPAPIPATIALLIIGIVGIGYRQQRLIKAT